MDEIPAFELAGVLLVVAAALGVRRLWNRHLLFQKLLDRSLDRPFILVDRVEQTDRCCALPQKLVHSGELGRGVSLNCHRDAVHRKDHDRTGSSARVLGVRMIW